MCRADVGEPAAAALAALLVYVADTLVAAGSNFLWMAPRPTGEEEGQEER